MEIQPESGSGHHADSLNNLPPSSSTQIQSADLSMCASGTSFTPSTSSSLPTGSHGAPDTFSPSPQPLSVQGAPSLSGQQQPPPQPPLAIHAAEQPSSSPASLPPSMYSRPPLLGRNRGARGRGAPLPSSSGSDSGSRVTILARTLSDPPPLLQVTSEELLQPIARDPSMYDSPSTSSSLSAAQASLEPLPPVAAAPPLAAAEQPPACSRSLNLPPPQPPSQPPPAVPHPVQPSAALPPGSGSGPHTDPPPPPSVSTDIQSSEALLSNASNPGPSTYSLTSASVAPTLAVGGRRDEEDSNSCLASSSDYRTVIKAQPRTEHGTGVPGRTSPAPQPTAPPLLQSVAASPTAQDGSDAFPAEATT